MSSKIVFYKGSANIRVLQTGFCKILEKKQLRINKKNLKKYLTCLEATTIAPLLDSTACQT